MRSKLTSIQNRIQKKKQKKSLEPKKVIHKSKLQFKRNTKKVFEKLRVKERFKKLTRKKKKAPERSKRPREDSFLRKEKIPSP